MADRGISGYFLKFWFVGGNLSLERYGRSLILLIMLQISLMYIITCILGDYVASKKLKPRVILNPLQTALTNYYFRTAWLLHNWDRGSV